ncbi:MAG: hypothetical protein KJI69_04900 [Patescibacteria group bacterium]|nr:hypothetical protein [Patescibacteria group bacterium]
MKHEDLIKLFKSGNFTIVYWDNESPSIYKGKWDINEEYEKDDYKEMEKHEISIDMYDNDGYIPDIVAWLTEALGGKSDTI